MGPEHNPPRTPEGVTLKQEVLNELRPVFEAVRSVEDSLKPILADERYVKLLNKISFRTDKLPQDLESLFNENSIGQTVEYYLGLNINSKDEILGGILKTFFRGANATALNQVFRMQGFIRDYASVYADPNKVAEVPAEYTAVMCDLYKDGQGLTESIARLREAFSGLGINIHDFNFLRDDVDKFGRNVRIEPYPPMVREARETNISLWPEVNDLDGLHRFNGKVADSSMYGCDSERFPDLVLRSNVYAWYV